MDDLVTWLRAQLDDDERVARQAASGGCWTYSGSDSVGAWTLYDEHWTIASLKTYRHEEYDYAARMPAARHPGYVDADANGTHIARWDPARVLAEVDAKRRILDLHEHVPAAPWGSTEVTGVGCTICSCRRDDVIGDGWCQTVRAVALPYADRPGYRDEWRPAGVTA